MVRKQTGHKDHGNSSVISKTQEDDLDVASIQSNCCSEYTDNPEQLDLRVLRGCRHMYNETNRILWSTNTLSFSDGNVFRNSIMTRTAAQKRLIKSLRRDMCFTRLDLDPDWSSALTMAIVRSLKGLRHLRLRLEHNRDVSYYEARRKKLSTRFPPFVYCGN